MVLQGEVITSVALGAMRASDPFPDGEEEFLLHLEVECVGFTELRGV